MDKLKTTINRGLEAARWLEDEQVQQAWEDTQVDIARMWGETQSDQEDTREALYRELHGLKAVRARLERTVNEGKRAEAELRDAQEREKNASRRR